MKSATVVLTLVLACSMTGSSDAAQLHATFDLNVTDEGFVSLAREGQLVLPQFRLYDAHQRQVMDIGIGFSPEQFEADLRQALEHPSPIENARTLEQETQTLVQPHGSPLPPFPTSDYTAVKYWADWCAPCKELDKVLKEVLTSFPELRINILSVEADPTNSLATTLGEVSEAKPSGENPSDDGIEQIRVDFGQLPPELRERLMQGKMTEEDRARLREHAEQQEGKKSSHR